MVQTRSDRQSDPGLKPPVPKEVSNRILDSYKFEYQIRNGPNDPCLRTSEWIRLSSKSSAISSKTRGLIRLTNRIKIEEQVAIFVCYIIGHNLHTQAVQ